MNAGGSASGSGGGAGRPPGTPPPGSPPPGDQPPKGPRTRPPGLREQFGITRDAVMVLVRAHIELAKAELEDIKDEVARAAGLFGIAIACLLLMAIMLPIALILFLGEWLWGSIGWGVLQGTELLIGIAVAASLAALRVKGPTRDFLVALIVGVIFGAILAYPLGYRLGAACGVSIGLLVWPILMGLTVRRSGIDAEALKARFWPQMTIDTTKETIEWAKQRSPLGPRS